VHAQESTASFHKRVNNNFVEKFEPITLQMTAVLVINPELVQLQELSHYFPPLSLYYCIRLKVLMFTI